LQVEDLAQGQPHVRDGADVKRVAEAGDLRGPDLHGVVVAGHRGDLPRVQPGGGVHRDARERIEVEVAPVAPVEVPTHVAGANQQEIAPPDVDTGSGRGGLEVGDGDRVAGLERAHDLVAGHVQQHAAADELVPGLVDAVLCRAGAGDEVGGVAVPHLAVVEDV